MEETQEIWKPIKGYEGLYEVSNLGRVKSIQRPSLYRGKYTRIIKERILKPNLKKEGYLDVHLRDRGRDHFFKIHRLVAIAFIPNPDNLPQINHIDENKLNNRVENLEWCTAHYNGNYGTINLRRSLSSGKPVRCIETGAIFHSLQAAAKAYGLHEENVCQVCRGLRKQVKGYHFEYVEKLPYLFIND